MAEMPIDRTAAAPTAAAPVAQPPAQNTQQLRALAAQFESLLLAQMLREMRASMFDEDESKSSGFGGNPLTDSLFSELSIALSRAGGVGLGDAVVGPLARQAALDGDASLASLAAMPTSIALPTAPVTSMPQALTDIEAPVVLPGRVTSAFGWRRDPLAGDARFHKGVDLAMPVGQDVPVARAGSVTFAGEAPGYGLTVVVDHGGKTSTRYAHLSEIAVREGDEVAAGQTIAKSGATGRATGPHLHFELLVGGVAVDPTTAQGSGLEARASELFREP